MEKHFHVNTHCVTGIALQRVQTSKQNHKRAQNHVIFFFFALKTKCFCTKNIVFVHVLTSVLNLPPGPSVVALQLESLTL